MNQLTTQCRQVSHMQRIDTTPLYRLTSSDSDPGRKTKNYNTELDIKRTHKSLLKLSCWHEGQHECMSGQMNTNQTQKSCHASSLQTHKGKEAEDVGQSGRFTLLCSALRHIMLWQQISLQLVLPRLEKCSSSATWLGKFTNSLIKSL